MLFRSGFCVRQHAVNGILLVKVVNGFELDELHDVTITSIANNDLLQYTTTGNVWKNVSSVAANKITGTALTQADVNTITNSNLRQSVGLSVIGNATNATANVADITAGTDAHVLRRSGTTVGFGTIADASISAGAAIAYSKLNLTGSILAGDMSSTYPGHAVVANTEIGRAHV